MKGTAIERFERKVLPLDDGCWMWVASTAGGGYGHFHVEVGDDGKSRRVPAHRFAYEHFIGPIPEGLHVDHLCRNRWCVNPDHLEPVTQQENIRRGYWATKTHCPRGHEYTEDNTYRAARGDRQCRTCIRARGSAASALRRRQSAKNNTTPTPQKVDAHA